MVLVRMMRKLRDLTDGGRPKATARAEASCDRGSVSLVDVLDDSAPCSERSLFAAPVEHRGMVARDPLGIPCASALQKMLYGEMMPNQISE